MSQCVSIKLFTDPL